MAAKNPMSAQASAPVTVCGYGRASDCKQEITPALQEETVGTAFNAYMQLGRSGVTSMGFPPGSTYAGFFCDKAESSSTPFLQRPEGSEIVGRLANGGAIIVSKYDRMFRGVVDFCTTVDQFIALHIRLIMLDWNLDTGTINGYGLSQILAVVKWMEREATRERTRETLGYLKRQGRSLGVPSIGWKRVRCLCPGDIKPKSYLVPDHARRRVLARVIELYDLHGLSFEDIALRFGRESHRNPRTGKPYAVHYFSDGYAAAKNGYPIYGQHIKPAPIPTGATRVRLDESVQRALDDVS